MAETIRGINVVIGAETTGLSAALSEVNRRSRDIQGELRQVERLLRFDPSNTELLAQQQRLLSDAVSNSRERLDRLRAAQEQVNEQFRRGEISGGQYRAFQREVAAAEQELRRFENRLEETQQAGNNLGESLQRTGEKLKGIGTTLTTTVSAPLAAAGALLLKGTADAQAAQGKLQASLGLTADEAKRLGDVAREVWKDGFGENIDEVNQALVNVRQNMAGLAEVELAQVTEGALTIAQVFEQDVKEVTASAGVMMKNFSISGQEALDLITVGFQKGGDFSGELLDTLREYSPQFKSLGLSADQAMAMLISGAQAGAWNLDKVGDAMKEFNIRAQDGSKTTAEGFAAIGLNAQEMGAAIAKGGEDAQKAFLATVTALASISDPLQQNIAGVALFGTQWEDVRSQVITALADGKAGLGDFAGATESARKAIEENNPFLALKKSARELQDALKPALEPIVDIIENSITPAVKSLATWFSELSPTGQKAALAIAGIAIAAGPLLIVAGSLASIFSSLAIAAGVLGVSIGAIAAPVAAVVAAIGLLVGAGVLLYKNWDNIKAFGLEMWASIQQAWTDKIEAIKALWQGFKDSITEVWNTLWSAITERFNTVKQAITQATTVLTDIMLGKWESFKTGLTAIWGAITGAIKGYINNQIGFINKLIDALNSIQVDIPEWVPGFGGQKFGINLPHVPMLAEGGIVTRPTLAMIGEAGPEAVVPLSKMPGTVIEQINIYGNDADEIWDKFERKLHTHGVRL
ncbi:MAG: phage tail tape measure protein [Bacillota bacterium]